MFEFAVNVSPLLSPVLVLRRVQARDRVWLKHVQALILRLLFFALSLLTLF